MKKEITVGQFLFGSISIICTIIGSWISMSNKVQRNETRIDGMEKRIEVSEKRYEAMFNIFNTKLDRNGEKIDQIIGELKHKN